MNIKQLEQVIEMCWKRYIGHMLKNEMRQRPGRSEYTIELINAGLLPKGQKGWSELFWQWSPKTEIGKAILRVERRMKRSMKK